MKIAKILTTFFPVLGHPRSSPLAAVGIVFSAALVCCLIPNRSLGRALSVSLPFPRLSPLRGSPAASSTSCCSRRPENFRSIFSIFFRFLGSLRLGRGKFRWVNLSKIFCAKNMVQFFFQLEEHDRNFTVRDRFEIFFEEKKFCSKIANVISEKNFSFINVAYCKL